MAPVFQRKSLALARQNSPNPIRGRAGIVGTDFPGPSCADRRVGEADIRLPGWDPVFLLPNFIDRGNFPFVIEDHYFGPER